MKNVKRPSLDAYLRDAESWAEDRNATADRSRRIAWWVAGVAAAIALLEAIALVLLVPLKKTEPYTLMVDRQTGFVQAIDPLSVERISPDSALTRSFLAQYVVARESFAIDRAQSDYRKVALWSAGGARDQYMRAMQPDSATSPFNTLPRRAVVDVEIRSVTSLSADTALIRFTTRRSDGGAPAQSERHYAATVTWRFRAAEMTADDRLLNPLGFQVTRYRRSPETLPEARPAAVAPAPAPVAVPSPVPSDEPAR